MTDNEIIKALSMCRENEWSCEKCHYNGVSKYAIECRAELLKDAINLINRQKAEIKELHNAFYNEDRIKVVRTKAIKEFAERLKEKAEHGWIISGVEDYAVSLDNIDNLVKEMVGDDND